MKFSEMLRDSGMTSGVVYATGLMKGHEAARMIADCKAQETIREMSARVLEENKESVGRPTQLQNERSHNSMQAHHW
jgi:hypothetical protein